MYLNIIKKIQLPLHYYFSFILTDDKVVIEGTIIIIRTECTITIISDSTDTNRLFINRYVVSKINIGL